jgi:hypothetical protein
MKKTQVVSAKVPAEFHEKLQKKLKEHGFTISEYIKSKLFDENGELQGLDSIPRQTRKLTQEEKDRIFNEELEKLTFGLEDLDNELAAIPKAGKEMTKVDKIRLAEEVGRKMKALTKDSNREGS